MAEERKITGIFSCIASGAHAYNRKLKAEHVWQLASRWAEVTPDAVLEAAWHLAQNEVNPSKLHRSAMVGDTFKVDVNLEGGHAAIITGKVAGMGFVDITVQAA